MLDTLRMLISDSLPAVPDLAEPIHPADIRVAACALLLGVAHADRRLSREERVVIIRSLTTHFGVDERGALELMDEAERQLSTAADESSFTRQLLTEYDDDQRHVLADMLWDVASADGWLDEHESFLAAKLEQWLGVQRTRGETPRETDSA
jgi:uncharacterized tellurite resistance protein B-like protein